MILTQINGRYFLEVSEEQVARAQALADAQNRWSANQAHRSNGSANAIGIADVFHLILAPAMIAMESKWMRELRDIEAGALTPLDVGLIAATRAAPIAMEEC